MQRALLALVVFAALWGFAFATVSTQDFVAHLDRQVHGIHCSFIPGGGETDVSGTSGCHVTLMSPYSSILRDRVWGGIPIALPAMAVFAYLAFLAIAIILVGRENDRRAAGYLTLSSLLPTLASLVMAYISFTQLGTACKLCVGIYISSFSSFLFALVAFLRAGNLAPSAEESFERAAGLRIGRPRPIVPIDLGTSDETLKDDSVISSFGAAETAPALAAEEIRRPLATSSDMERRMREPSGRVRTTRRRAPLGLPVFVTAFALGILFVVVPVGAYAANAPDFGAYLGSCGTLANANDPHHVLVPLGPQTGSVDMIEVLDPLCPSCRGFEQRFSTIELASEARRKALLFPLDSTCNWMVDSAIHPGACTISEAVLCAQDEADEVLAWAFEHQEEIRTETERDTGAAARMVRTRFPRLGSCVGTPEARNKINRGLRWAVENRLPVLTPQVYVGANRVCDADTDLGLDWTLTRLFERARGAR
jgi:uncharacterized membrane protein